MSTCLSLILEMSFNDIYDDVKSNCLDGSKHELLPTLLRALETISPSVDSLTWCTYSGEADLDGRTDGLSSQVRFLKLFLYVKTLK